MAKGDFGELSRALLRNNQQVPTQRIPESCFATALPCSRASDIHGLGAGASSLYHSSICSKWIGARPAKSAQRSAGPLAVNRVDTNLDQAGRRQFRRIQIDVNEVVGEYPARTAVA